VALSSQFAAPEQRAGEIIFRASGKWFSGHPLSMCGLSATAWANSDPPTCNAVMTGSMSGFNVIAGQAVQGLIIALFRGQ
jgi:hypothetical protein